MTSSPADVLGHGSDRRARLGVPRRLRAPLVGAALVAAALVAGQADLLSSGPGAGPLSGTAGDAVGDGLRPVARDGHYFVTARPGGPERWLAAPTPLPPAAGLVAVTGARAADGHRPQLLLASHDGLLFRADMPRSRWQPLGAADRLVSAAYVPGRALVLRAGRLQEVEVARGRTTDPAPFPGYDGRTWRARGVLDAAGLGALVMTRDAPDGSVEVALAWPRGATRVGLRPDRETLGRVGAFLGVSGRWVVALDRSCPGTACALVVLRATDGGLVTGRFAAPAGWRFVEGPVGGRPPRMLVTVQSLRTGGDALAALAGRRSPAVLVPGSGGVRQEAGLVPGPEGSVYLLSRRRGGGDEVVVYDPASPPALTRVARLPAGTRLVCVCG